MISNTPILSRFVRSAFTGIAHLILAFVLCLLIAPAGAQTHGGGAHPSVRSPEVPSKPLAPVTTPASKSMGPLLATAKPLAMRLLVLTGDGTEPSYAAIRAFLDQIGIPYDAVVLATTTLPPLSDASKGLYQGIILATGNLVVCGSAGCASALPPEGWTALDNYAYAYGVRTLSYYTFPDPRYGIQWTGCTAGTTVSSPGTVTFEAAASGIFSSLYMTPAPQVKVAGAWTYFASLVPATGETTTAVLTMSATASAAATCASSSAATTGTVGVYHQTADGRESVALTFDNNPNLLHSLTLNYGLLNWVTRGVFLGARKTYLSTQVDDLFLASDIYDPSNSNCVPSGFALDPASDAAAVCPQVRISSQDISRLASWQSSLRSQPQTAAFKIALPFNGFGTTTTGGAPSPDTLTSWVKANSSQFYWVSHTYDHRDLDCYKLNGATCTPATYPQSVAEITNNAKVAKNLGLALDSRSMVTPDVSGLSNPAFLRAAADKGIRYLVTDASRPSGAAPSANTGIINPLQPSILGVPRHPTNIFFNVVNNGDHPLYGPTLPAGSEPSEFNFFYGPGGLVPFFTSDQTYPQVIENESDNLLTYMMRYEPYPIMFHQANAFAYDGANSLLSDVLTRTLQKFQALFTLPVLSLEQSSIGDLLSQRMAYNNSGLQAVLTPGVNITLTVVNAATVPITGICANNGCETYGNQKISRVNVAAGSTVTLTF